MSWQLNAAAAPYLCGVHKPYPLLREETVPAVRGCQLACALVSFPEQCCGIWPGNETTCAHAYKI